MLEKVTPKSENCQRAWSQNKGHVGWAGDFGLGVWGGSDTFVHVSYMYGALQRTYRALCAAQGAGALFCRRRSQVALSIYPCHSPPPLPLAVPSVPRSTPSRKREMRRKGRKGEKTRKTSRRSTNVLRCRLKEVAGLVVRFSQGLVFFLVGSYSVTFPFPICLVPLSRATPCHCTNTAVSSFSPKSPVFFTLPSPVSCRKPEPTKAQ